MSATAGRHEATMPHVTIWEPRLPSTWAKIVPVTLTDDTKEFLDKSRSQPANIVIDKRREVVAFHRFADKYMWHRRITTLLELQEFVTTAGSCKKIAATEIRSGSRDVVARQLKPIYDELKALCKRLTKEQGRASVYKVNGIPETELLLVNLTPFVPPSTLIKPSVRNEQVSPLLNKSVRKSSDEVGTFAGMVSKPVKREYQEPDSQDPVPYTEKAFQFVSRFVGHLLRDFGKCQLLGNDAANDPQLQSV